MRKILCFFMPLLLVSCLGEKEMKISVEEQASEWGNYLRKGLYERYLDNMAHFVYADNAQRAALKKSLESRRSFMQERGDEMVSVESHLYSDILENNGYYQCMVRQTQFMKNDKTVFETNVYILAVSENGSEWKFADVTNLTTRLVKAVFPDLHPDIKIEKRIAGDE